MAHRSPAPGWLTVGGLPMLVGLLSCAAPGPPLPQRGAPTAPPSHLLATQVGWTVQVSCTLPQRDLYGRNLAAPLELLLYRTYGHGDTLPRLPSAPTRTFTVPPDAASPFTFTDPIPPADREQVLQGTVVYWLRTKAASAAPSAPAGPLVLKLVPPPPAPIGLEAEATTEGIALHWQTSSGPLPPTARFVIYRQPVTPSARWEALAETDATSFTDATVLPGSDYRYRVRVRESGPAGTVESDDSNTAVVSFARRPPPPPVSGLVAAVVFPLGGPAEVDLSWLPVSSMHVIGYHVYRSQDAARLGQRLTSRPQVTTTFADSAVATGQQYFYRVTAVDDQGQESPPCAPVPAKIPAGTSGSAGR